MTIRQQHLTDYAAAAVFKLAQDAAGIPIELQMHLTEMSPAVQDEYRAGIQRLVDLTDRTRRWGMAPAQTPHRPHYDPEAERVIDYTADINFDGKLKSELDT